MSISRITLPVLFTLGMLLFGGCAGLHSREPIQVIMVGVEPLQGEGLEMRMMVKLRIQNPNDSPLDFSGVSVQLDVQGKSCASGVSDVAGSVLRYGETIVNVPVISPSCEPLTAPMQRSKLVCRKAMHLAMGNALVPSVA